MVWRCVVLGKSSQYCFLTLSALQSEFNFSLKSYSQQQTVGTLKNQLIQRIDALIVLQLFRLLLHGLKICMWFVAFAQTFNFVSVMTKAVLTCTTVLCEITSFYSFALIILIVLRYILQWMKMYIYFFIVFYFIYLFIYLFLFFCNLIYLCKFGHFSMNVLHAFLTVSSDSAVPWL